MRYTMGDVTHVCLSVITNPGQPDHTKNKRLQLHCCVSTVTNASGTLK